MSGHNSDEVEKLLMNWEDIYKKGLLTFWLLLLLHERPAYAYEINDAVQKISQQTISADNNSIYRALSRFEDMGIVDSELRASDMGPARKYYRLSEKGVNLLAKFIQRNILLFEKPIVAERIHSVVDGTTLLVEEK